MGCTMSRAEHDEEVPAAARRKIKCQHRHRKGSISGADLLHPEDPDATDEETSPHRPAAGEPSSKMALAAPQVAASPSLASTAEAVNVKDVAEEEGKKITEEAAPPAEKEEEKLEPSSAGDMVPPGSPSFRFYFVASVHDSDDDSFRREEDKNEKKPEESNNRNDGSLSSRKELEGKPHKEEKGKRFHHGLSGAPGVLYSLLNVGSCYCSHSAAPSALQHGRTPLITENAD